MFQSPCEDLVDGDLGQDFGKIQAKESDVLVPLRGFSGWRHPKLPAMSIGIEVSVPLRGFSGW